ncbi:MAG: hypothetical protein GC162_20640 [Planctomycetes bacterium]|nr:hypothetical protein [Planctomycetota bacterium]
MPMRREFLGWDAACLPAAASWLLRHLGPQMRDVTVALPGSRAGRRLLELLVESAAATRTIFTPPRLITAGQIIDHLYPPPMNPAGDVARRLAWSRALIRTDVDILHDLVPELPDDVHALAGELDQLYETVAANGLDFAAVADRAASLPDFREGERWAALAAIQSHYFDELQRVKLVDLQAHRAAAVRTGKPRDGGPLVLIALADLNTLQRRAIEAVADRAIALIHAPPDRTDDFDVLGCLRIDVWHEVKVNLPDALIEVVDRPADQAAAVVCHLADLDPPVSADQITIGVCDDEVGPHLEQRLKAHGAAARSAGGVEVARTSPLRFLAALADWLEHRRYTDFATLLRHPDVEDYLRDQLAAEGIDDWLTLMDDYYNRYLQVRLTGRWLGEESTAARLKSVYDAVHVGLLADLSDTPHPLRQWAAPLAQLMIRLYGRHPLDRGVESHRLIIEACQRVREVLDEMLELPADLDEPVTIARALRMLIAHAVLREPIAPEADEAAIELLGPLELQLDDAAVLIITGFNEGRLPASVNADRFLPDAMRRHLGLIDNRRRYARDAYALSAMLASRRRMHLIAGRRGAQGDPLLPSRLMFACDDADLPRRVGLFHHASAARLVSAPVSPHGVASAFKVPPPPDPLAEPITSLSVTAFRAYIACPYRFYLGHVLGLTTLDDQIEELDGGAFGSLAHEVLSEFGRGPAAHAVDAKVIAKSLDKLLDRAAAHLVGVEALPAVRVQVEQLRSRLHAFAAWQAEWASEGWRIATKHVEHAVRREHGVSINVDDKPMGLTGRIDRVDVHERTGEVVVFDYKTGDVGDDPEKAHRKKSGEWIDLQLPLYRYLAASMGYRGAVRLGYILLPKSEHLVRAAIAEWTDDDLRHADETARDIIRAIRDEVFWPPSEGIVFDDFAAICGVEQFIAAGDEAEGEDES